MSAVVRIAERVSSFFSSAIWREGTEGQRRREIVLHRAGRVAYSAFRGYFEHGLTFRAAALTYFTVLSIVPFLAFAFAILKGLGAYRAFVQDTLRPWLAQSFGANTALQDASERILRFVEHTDVSNLGILGLLLLVYTSVSLVSNVETALNRIWGATAGRPFLRQLTDYVTLLVTTPLLVLAAATFSTAAQTSSFVDFLRGTLKLGPVIDLLLHLTPVAVVWVALFAMYVILPNVRTRATSAAFGAAVAAVAWQGALVLHFQSQVTVARYNALYSFLGAVPLFLVWTYVSWLIVLCGAELAASHQYEQVARERFLARRADQELKEALAVAAAAAVTRDFLSGAPRRSAAGIARLLRVPPPLADEVLGALDRAGILARAVAGRETGWLPGRDIDEVRASDVREAVRRDPRADELRAAVERRLGPGIQGVLRGFDESARDSPRNLTLRELAAEVETHAPREPARGGDGHEAAVVDAKEPEVPP